MNLEVREPLLVFSTSSFLLLHFLTYFQILTHSVVRLTPWAYILPEPCELLNEILDYDSILYASFCASQVVIGLEKGGPAERSGRIRLGDVSKFKCVLMCF